MFPLFIRLKLPVPIVSIHWLNNSTLHRSMNSKTALRARTTGLSGLVLTFLAENEWSVQANNKSTRRLDPSIATVHLASVNNDVPCQSVIIQPLIRIRPRRAKHQERPRRFLALILFQAEARVFPLVFNFVPSENSTRHTGNLGTLKRFRAPPFTRSIFDDKAT